jgi:hypothetical protein
MFTALQMFAVLGGSLFAGAAVYVSLVEHPARMGCDTRTAATVWAPSYRRATLMQAPLAVAACLAGVGIWWLGGSVVWLIGALLIGAVVPFSQLVVMRTNRQLLAPGRDLSSRETRVLLQIWGKLHGVRSVLGVAAAIVYAGMALG